MCEHDDADVTEWLAARKREAAKIDADTAEVFWCYGLVLDPYGVEADLPSEWYQIGRVYFARRPCGDIWVSFYDLPDETRKMLYKRAWSEDLDDFTDFFVEDDNSITETRR